MYQNTNSGTCMPLLMGCTQPEVIREAESAEPVVYDPVAQVAIVPFEMRIVGTKSLKSHNTQKGPGKTTYPDKKNEIDDQKNA